MWLPPYRDQGKVAPYVTDIATDCHTSSRCHVTTVTILLQDLHQFIALLITLETNNRITNRGFIWFLLGVSCLHVLRQLLLPWCGRDQQLIPSARWSQETAVRRQCRVLVGGAAQGRGRTRDTGPVSSPRWWLECQQCLPGHHHHCQHSPTPGHNLSNLHNF